MPLRWLSCPSSSLWCRRRRSGGHRRLAMTRHGRPRVACVPLLALVVALTAQEPGPPDPADYLARSRRFTEQIEAKGLAEPFKGVTSNGTIVPGLFPIRSAGVST